MEGFPGELSLLDQEDEHGQGSACLSWSIQQERGARGTMRAWSPRTSG